MSVCCEAVQAKGEGGMLYWRVFRKSPVYAVVILTLLSGCSASVSRQEKELINDRLAQAAERPQKQPRSRRVQEQFDPVSSIVAPGYQILISCEEDPNLNGEFRIEHDGILKLPYYIMLNVRGMTQPQLRAAIVGAYHNYFQSPPEISIRVIERKYSIAVQGLVTAPGEYLFKQDATLDDLIAAAGGLRETAPGVVSARYVAIEQNGETALLRMSEYYAGLRDLPYDWQGGEVVFFQSEAEGFPVSSSETSYVQIIGQVATPGEILYEPGADIFHYLARAGGPTEGASLTNLDLIRSAQGGRATVNFSLRDPNRVPEILPGDIVLVNAERTGFYVAVAAVLSAVATVVIAAVAL